MTTQTTVQHSIYRPDGRRIAVQVSGPDDGLPVLLGHSAPGSRLLDPDPQATAAAGVRLITLDRPGYGESARLGPGVTPTIALFADDCAAVLDHFAVTAAAVAGWSAGGRVAMALAARRPELVRLVALIATPAPDEHVAWIGAEEKAMISALLADPESALTTLEKMLAPMTSDPAAGLSLVGAEPGEEGGLTDDLRADLEVMLTAAFAQGSAGLAADLISYTVQPWGFDPRAVGAPVRCWYGETDSVISPEHGRWWADQVADGAVVVLPGAGHLLVRPVWSEVLDWFSKTA